MLNKKIKTLIISFLLGTVVVGSAFGVKAIKTRRETNLYTNTAIVISENKKVLEAKAIVDEVQALNKLEVLQLNLSKNVKLKEGQYFKKEKNVKLKGVVTFKIDLSNINPDSIVILGNEIKIFTKAPELEVTLLEDKTEFGETKNGFLSFGDIEMTCEEFEILKTNTKANMLDEAKIEIETAKEKAVASIKKSLLTLTKSDYDVKVVWVE